MPEIHGIIQKARDLGYRIASRERINAYCKKYRDEHTEQRRANAHRWNKEHIEERRAYYKAHRKYDPEKSRAARIKWESGNQITRWAMNCRSNHRKVGYEILLSTAELARFAEEHAECAYCGIPLDYSSKRNVPKFLAPSLDRKHNEKTISLNNIQILCLKCNRMKGNVTHGKFVEYCGKVWNKYCGEVSS